MATIEDFLGTGRLGPIHAGMTADDVRGVLGEPEDVSVRRDPTIWKYGALQLAFSRGHGADPARLTSINLYFHDPESTPPARLGLTGWMPTSETTVEELKDSIEGFDPQVFGDAAGLGQAKIALKSGAYARFDEGKLYGLSYQARTGPIGKQITLFLPEDILAILRSEAHESGIPVAGLCARLLVEWANDHRTAGVPVEVGKGC